VDAVFVAERAIPGSDQTGVYLTAKTVTNQQFLVELKFKAGAAICKISVKSPNKALSSLVLSGFKSVVSR